MLLRSLLAACAVFGGVALSSAEASPGVATGSVNLRAGPGTGYAKITTIPAGAPVEVFQCSSWCQVGYGGYEGWASAKYIADAGYDAAPAYSYRPAPPVYAYRAPMPARAYWRHNRPWWDDHYDTWYDGRGWWYDDDWYDRPRTGIYFQFGG